MKTLLLAALVSLTLNTIQFAQASEYFIDIPTKSSGNIQVLVNINAQLPMSAALKTEVVENLDNGQLVNSYCETKIHFSNALTGFMTFSRNDVPFYRNDFSWDLSYLAQSGLVDGKCQAKSTDIPQNAQLNTTGRQMYTSVVLDPRLENRKLLNLEFYAPSIKNSGLLKRNAVNKYSLLKLTNPEILQVSQSFVN